MEKLLHSELIREEEEVSRPMKLWREVMKWLGGKNNENN